MKNFILPAAFILVSALAQAQEYTVKANTRLEGVPPEYAAYGERDITTYIKGSKIKNEATSMMGSEISMYDGKTHTFLSEAMGNKIGYTVSDEELDKESKGKKEERPKVVYTSEKKTVAGYECTKALAIRKGKEGTSDTIVLWTTDKINFDISKVKKDGRTKAMDWGDVKGYPLLIEMKMGFQGQSMKVIITTTEISTKPVDDSVFKLNTEGYTMLTYTEAMNKMKALAGDR
jgi:hypothetical protein